MVSQPAYPRVESSEGLDLIKAQMVAMMKRHGFNGLAAPQVGIMLQLVVVKLEDGAYLDLVNPEITRMYGAEVEELETCSSCPPQDNTCKVARMQIIHLKASSIYNLENVEDLRFKGNYSRVIQHEIDHLQGVFFFNRASIKDSVEVVQRFKNWRHQWRLNNEREKHGSDSITKTKEGSSV